MTAADNTLAREPGHSRRGSHSVDAISKGSGSVITIHGNLVRITKILPDPREPGRITIHAHLLAGRSDAGMHGLTKREYEIALRLVARESTREIAAALGISPHTVRRHTERILAKLGVNSRHDVRLRLPAHRKIRKK